MTAAIPDDGPAPVPEGRVDLYALDRAGLADLLASLGEPSYRAGQVAAWLARGVDDPHAMSDLPAALRERLADLAAGSTPELVAHHVADGGRTHKFLLRFADGEAIEAVLMLYPRRATVCVSTQAGCAMGCPFCATGQAGLRRQLTAGEVVRQVAVAQRALAARRGGDVPLDLDGPDHVTNVVFMGMGEPLANLGATTAAVRWLHDPEGFGLSARALTVSTVGLVPAIGRLADLGLPLTLAVSLHAATDALRDELVPVNRVHPIAELERAVRAYRTRTRRRVSLEWCLIGDVNDDDAQADALAGIARRLRAHVNIIPMNPTPGVRWREPDPDRTRAFADRVGRAGVAVTLRDTRGRDAEAACGQLLAARTLGGGRIQPLAAGAADRVAALGVRPTAAAPAPNPRHHRGTGRDHGRSGGGGRR
ncbi:MAG: 23S rRNA (adenine(2503)-C(2))-methyltransferase RlmN [Nitriliruptoraceae bacterium]